MLGSAGNIALGNVSGTGFAQITGLRWHEEFKNTLGVVLLLLGPYSVKETLLSLSKGHPPAIPESLLTFLRARGSREGGDAPAGCDRMPQPSTAPRACPT